MRSGGRSRESPSERICSAWEALFSRARETAQAGAKGAINPGLGLTPGNGYAAANRILHEQPGQTAGHRPMTLEPLPLAGAFRVKFPRFDDERGYFRRTFSREIFADAGLADCTLECSLALNARRGTLRGMHFQRAPHGETKFIYAVSGAIFDVIVDLRPRSSTYGRW